MIAFPEGVGFRFPWRPYQGRVLAELEGHLSDERLHVVAPPGSGKTVLGLEVARRLNRPTLILAPSRAIRDQWVDRFVTLFLPEADGTPEWISRRLDAPGFLTVGTYQGLHALCGRAGFGPLVGAGVRAIVLDEAHHLKNEWWKSLTALADALRGAALVSLTATPPRDVSAAEWNRYQALCGPVDAAIGVPELVREKNLCPHQDYVCLSAPTEEDRRVIGAFREAAARFVADIRVDFDVIDAAAAHPWITDARRHLNAIYENTPYFSSLIIFLAAVGRPVPAGTLAALNASGAMIPALDLQWLETLLTAGLFHPTAPLGGPDLRSALAKRLGRMGALARRRVTLRATPRIQRRLTASAGKLESIVAIVRRGSESLGERLRMVILTDFIRAGDMPDRPGPPPPLRRLGVVPIFERVRREYLWGVRPAILSGSLVVIPESALADLKILAVADGLAPEAIGFSPLVHDPGFGAVTGAGAAGHRMVHLMTRLFALGEVNLLVGTSALLGEGWDAPWINSLILATRVGSWVLSNQMRGRAIRTVRDDPEKTAAIWHLVCLESVEGAANPRADGSDAAVANGAVADGAEAALANGALAYADDGGAAAEDGGPDMAAFRRRMRAFVGVSHSGDRIESGAGRLDLPPLPLSAGDIAAVNMAMFRRAADRRGLRVAWARALRKGGRGGAMVEILRAPVERMPRAVTVRGTPPSLLRRALAWSLPAAVLSAGWLLGGGIAVALAAAGAGVWLLGVIPNAARAFWRAARYGLDGTTLKLMADALLAALVETGQIQKSEKRPFVRVRPGVDRMLNCALEGAGVADRTRFLDALDELTSPVDNPRYLIHWRPGAGRRGRAGRRGDDGAVPFAVPGCLGAKKEHARIFLAAWRRRMGPAELIYTRTPKGRGHLVAARLSGLCRTDAPNRAGSNKGPGCRRRGRAEAERMEIWR